MKSNPSASSTASSWARPEPLAEVDDWLGPYRALWEQRFGALHTEIARGKQERRRDT
jgi:hypothetical protein